MDSDRIEQIMEDEIASFIKQSHEDEARLRASFEELRERYNESEPDFGYEEIDEEQHEETEEEKNRIYKMKRTSIPPCQTIIRPKKNEMTELPTSNYLLHL